MSTNEIVSHETLVAFLRNWRAWSGGEYDFGGMAHLLGACLANLGEFGLEAELEDIGEWLEPQQVAFMHELASWANPPPLHTAAATVAIEDAPERVDLLIDGKQGELLSVAFSTGDLCLQWHSLPNGALRTMHGMLTQPTGTFRELRVGEVFGTDLCLIEREGIFSFKARADAAGSDLVRVDLPPGVVVGFISALIDAIELWED